MSRGTGSSETTLAIFVDQEIEEIISFYVFPRICAGDDVVHSYAVCGSVPNVNLFVLNHNTLAPICVLSHNSCESYDIPSCIRKQYTN